ncbi:MAG: lysostaphin resistance A-like protein [Promethearchaeota archaeon]
MNSETGLVSTSSSDWRVFLGPLVLICLIYAVWILRYPFWWFFTAVEPIFLMLIISYAIVLLLAMMFLKKDAQKTLSVVFKWTNSTRVLIGGLLGIIFQITWLLLSFGIGGGFEFLPLFSLKGYENYAVTMGFLAFGLYLAFSIFGAFAEEMTFRSYTQTKVTSHYGYLVGILFSSLLFSMQHIHVFSLSWLLTFLQTQLPYVFCFGLFIGYLFYLSQDNLWTVFAFHSVVNIINVTLPIRVTFTLPFANLVVTIISFVLIFLLLRLWLRDQFVMNRSRGSIRNE